MKLMCKCGNVKDLKSDFNTELFEFRDCGDGTIALVCKRCDEVVFVKVKNS